MKIFIVGEVGYEYNDEDYYRPECSGVTPMKAFRVRENAEEECGRLNDEWAKQYDHMTTDGEPITEFFEVAEVEIADDDVETYAEARQRIKDAIEAAKQVARVAFKDRAAAIFTRHAGLVSFEWDQYTPYFNDGEACRFYAHTDEPRLYDDEGNELWGCETGDVRDFLQQFNGDYLLAMFGDHVAVRVYRDGRIETDGCDHH